MTVLSVIFVVAVLAGLYMAWNIGANDVANAMGTSVGSGALTFRRAIVLAGVFEFCGAMFVGSNVAETIRKGIVPIDRFVAVQDRAEPDRRGGDARPPAFEADRPGSRPGEARGAGGPADAQAMDFAVGMLSALLAAAIWLNVATFFGHPVSTTHAIVGAVLGFAVAARGFGSPDWLKVGQVSLSWIVSPLAGGLAAYVIYRCIRRFVLESRHPVFMAKRTVPIAAAGVVCVLCVSALYKGLSMRVSIWRALSAAAALGMITWLGVRIAIFRRTSRRRVRLSERYRVVEGWFARIQPVTACYVAFAHGANDVANAIGPLAGAIHVFRGGAVGAKAPVPAWLLALGGAGIVLGLATYGHKVIESVGKKITEMTPTRGFSAEFATATVVLLCSKLGMPISTTFVLVGAVMGVGMARGFAAIDLRVIRRIFTSWVITVPVSAVLAGLIYYLLKWLV